jgi:hypothetical protein
MLVGLRRSLASIRKQRAADCIRCGTRIRVQGHVRSVNDHESRRRGVPRDFICVPPRDDRIPRAREIHDRCRAPAKEVARVHAENGANTCRQRPRRDSGPCLRLVTSKVALRRRGEVHRYSTYDPNDPDHGTDCGKAAPREYRSWWTYERGAEDDATCSPRLSGCEHESQGTRKRPSQYPEFAEIANCV